MASHSVLVALTLVVFASSVLADDPSPLQDICVATSDPQAALFVNGRFCKDPKLATENDFFFRGLNIPGNTSNLFGLAINRPTVTQIPGLNTLGVSLGRIDFAPHGGLNPPHLHPRATELLVVIEGTLYVGFITSSPENRLFTKILHAGDVFVFPIGLVHFQFNIGETKAVAFAALGSQNPGNIIIANNVFGSNPPISADVLRKAFQLDKYTVNRLQNLF